MANSGSKTGSAAGLGEDMVRLLIHVEGQTEERFVNDQLAPYLLGHGWHMVVPLLFGKRNGRTGGVGAWPEVRRDVIKDLKTDTGRHVALMVDFYGMPAHGAREWPGRRAATAGSPRQRATMVEEALMTSVCVEGDFAERFHPYVMMHEFETLLYANPDILAENLGPADALPQLTQIVQSVPSLEHINDSRETSPSKRILSIDSGYQKAVDGLIVAQRIGLAVMRAQVAGFDLWLNRLTAE